MPNPRQHRSARRRPAGTGRPRTPRNSHPNRPSPWVELRSASFHAYIYNRMLGSASPDAKPGDVVSVYDRHGERFGSAFYNPNSQIALRMLTFDDRTVDTTFFESRLQSAVELRRQILRLDENTNAYRVIHSEGDELSGCVVDRYDDVLSVELFSYGAYRHFSEWLPRLHSLCGTEREIVRTDQRAARQEGFRPLEQMSEPPFKSVRIREHGVRFAVGFEAGHKTGFFCDQRENRRRLASHTAGKSVLDICCYTGGFSLHSAVQGEARETTGVDLDEKAIQQAKHNANLNQCRVKWVHADAFVYLRQMAQNDKQWDVVVLDPPKLIPSRDDREVGRRKYHDFNTLALSRVAPGGLFLTCSCSGLMQREAFYELVVSAAHRARRRIQVLDYGGAAPDHPVHSNCPEGAYLKALWARVL